MAKVATISFYEAPEAAIRAFEQWSGLRVAFHDIERTLIPFLPPGRYSHRNPFCDLLKKKGHEPACRRFELDVLRPWLLENPEGCAKVCHAGILEWSVPIRHDGRVSVVLFAGLRRRGRGVEADLTDDRPTRAFALWPDGVPKPEQVTPEQSRLFLEGLRQLAARLQLWMEEHERIEGGEIAVGKGGHASRYPVAIERFVVGHYRESVTLEDLARALHLSRSRTAHLAREVCGHTFAGLLRRYRLRHAAALLWQAQDSVTDVAMASGFGDVSNFHKAFRRRYGMTPLQYRKHGSMH